MSCRCGWSVSPRYEEWWELESKWRWLIFRGWLPLVVRGRRYRSLLCNRAPPPPCEREEANDAGVSHGVEGPVSPDAFCETPQWVWGQGYLLRWPKIGLPDQTPPNLPDTGGYCTGVWSLATRALGTPPRRQPGKAGGSVVWLPSPSLHSGHQRVSEGIHGMWEKCDN